MSETAERIIDLLVDECYDTAREKGWWEGEEHNIPEKIALMHSELSEALEEYRIDKPSSFEEYYEMSVRGDGGVTAKGLTKRFVNDDGTLNKPCGFTSELADTIIRIFDLAGKYDLPLGKAILEKMRFNRTRPYRHGGKRA